MEKKKIMSLFALSCGALLLVGCGTDTEKNDDKEEKKSNAKVLTCVMEEESDGVKSTAEMSFTFNKKSEKIEAGTMEMYIDYVSLLEDLTETEKEQTENLMSSMYEGMCVTFEEEGYVNCKSSNKVGKFEMSMDFDLEKIEDTTDGDVTLDTSIDDLKSYFEDEAEMECTIK